MYSHTSTWEEPRDRPWNLSWTGSTLPVTHLTNNVILLAICLSSKYYWAYGQFEADATHHTHLLGCLLSHSCGGFFHSRVSALFCLMCQRVFSHAEDWSKISDIWYSTCWINICWVNPMVKTIKEVFLTGVYHFWMTLGWLVVSFLLRHYSGIWVPLAYALGTFSAICVCMRVHVCLCVCWGIRISAGKWTLQSLWIYGYISVD